MGEGTLATAKDRVQSGGRYKYFSFFPAPIIQSPDGASHETLTTILLLRKHECHNLQGSVPWDTEEGRTGGSKHKWGK